MLSNLTIRKGGIYFLGPEEENAKELRARTFLAVADETDSLDCKFLAVDAKLLVVLSINRSVIITNEDIEWAKATPVNSGSIELAGKTSTWMEQPGKLVLLMESDLSYRDYLDRYFETPLRWLAQQNPARHTEIANAVQQVRRQVRDDS